MLAGGVLIIMERERGPQAHGMPIIMGGQGCALIIIMCVRGPRAHGMPIMALGHQGQAAQCSAPLWESSSRQ